MSTTDIRQKLHHYIETAQDKKVKALYAIFEEEIDEISIWTNDFLIEMNRRRSDFEKGKKKGRTWEAVKKKARKSLKLKSA
jgi:hypothetical protein